MGVLNGAKILGALRVFGKSIFRGPVLFEGNEKPRYNQEKIITENDLKDSAYKELGKKENNLVLFEDFNSIAFSGDYKDLENKPNFHFIAFSGDYKDLKNLPYIPKHSVVSDGETLVLRNENGESQITVLNEKPQNAKSGDMWIEEVV